MAVRTHGWTYCINIMSGVRNAMGGGVSHGESD